MRQGKLANQPGWRLQEISICLFEIQFQTVSQTEANSDEQNANSQREICPASVEALPWRIRFSKMMVKLAGTVLAASEVNPKGGSMPKKAQARTSSRTKKTGTSRRGFAAMSPEKRRKIAAMGGRHSHDGDRKRGENFWSKDEPVDKKTA